MKALFRGIKAVILWNYGRKTWQYDVLCALILAFIFLTPQRWFERSELPTHIGHQSSSAAVWLLVWPETLPANPDLQAIENHVRAVTGRPDGRLRGVRRVNAGDGRTVAYEVDFQ